METHATGQPGSTADEAPSIRGDEPGTLAWRVLHERHPKLLRQVAEGLPYGPEQRRALDELSSECADDGVLRPIEPDDAPDHTSWRRWEEWGRGHYGRRWTDVPFLWAESYFYRRLLAAVGYFGPGPWRGVDPFEPVKRAELAGEGVDAELAALDALEDLSEDERGAALVLSSLWGNRADLAFRVSARQGEVAGVGDEPALVRDLLVDDRDLVWKALRDGAPGRVCLVADNAGPELLPDLALVDHLLRSGLAAEVLLHVKPHPYFVSDATTADVLAGLRRLAAAPGAAAAVGARLWEAMGDGRLRIRAHGFSCAPLAYRDMPEEMRVEFAGASLTIFKGDLNYRRLVGDRAWPGTTPFAERTDYFPGPLVALRTLKSDVLVGVAGETLAALDATGPRWRSAGTHALISARV
ncbi:damage-control phosphatase ARMT1 family protein [Allostreptomyces psammosilenae]|uniref:Uncharacterized protein with ATP-grasp and redox domains n=1 Tax=Allostreptomyces psammosilenae TaxID=1892865 RepID=A0A852ZVZ2_9ACTN|nr:damage-control phosphatase ARMT1 family protein [Allostreptomyces psammosilenae]NYI05827.1 uncharacterized protein with ATP-grasp and redox domains [Allostreptomyces psammosilenae]